MTHATAARLLPALALLALVPCARAQHAAPSAGARVLPLRERAALRDGWLRLRLERLVPELMRRAEIDLWIVASREYAEDPLFPTFAPSTWLAARRRTVLVFHDRGPEEGVERLCVSRYGIGDLFEAAWDPDEEPDQLAALAALVAERDPARIGLNVSRTFALADGLTASERDALLERLSPELRARVVSAEALAIGWLEGRIAEELEVYPSLVRIAHEILDEGLSEAAVQPGHTTTADLEWWFRERILDRRLATWFHPSVSVQRRASGQEGEAQELSFSEHPDEAVILPGDLIHVDFGITYVRLNTDTQQHAYVLRTGEDDAPAGLRRALALGNRVQDLLTAEFALDRSGNEVLGRALSACRAEGLAATIYTHPLGFHGHGAGPTIGLWDRQDGVPGRGDWPLSAPTTHSIELAVRVDVPEWGREVDVMLEEDALFDGERVTYLDGRQTELFLIPRRR